GFQITEAIFDQFEPAPRLFDEIGAARDRALIAVDADHSRARGGKNCARKSAGAERGIDIEAALTDVEPFNGAMDEHGNVTSQSASDSRAAAARHHSRAPSGFGGASAAIIRAPSSCLKARTFSVASASSVRKRPGSQIRNLCPRPTNETVSVIPAWLLSVSVRTMRPSPSIFSVSLVP